MFDTSDFDLAPYTDFDMDRFVQRTYCSWQDAGWRSLLVQRFTQVRAAEDLPLPGVRDLHLVLCTSGDTEMRIHAGGKPARRRWGAGRVELMVPDHSTVRSYRATSPMHTIQVHIPRATVERVADELGGQGPDFEALDALNRFEHAFVVVLVADGELDARREAGRSGGGAHQRPDVARPLLLRPHTARAHGFHQDTARPKPRIAAAGAPNHGGAGAARWPAAGGSVRGR